MNPSSTSPRTPEPAETAQQFCQLTIDGLKEKADHNKREALWTFMATIGATLATPVFVTLGPGIVLGKIIPSVHLADGRCLHNMASATQASATLGYVSDGAART